MKNLLTALSIIAISLPGIAQQAEHDKGIAAYNLRAEGATGQVAKAEKIDEAIKHFTTASADKETELESSIMLMKCYYYKGTFVETEKDARLVVYNSSKALGEKMMTTYPKSAAVVYWHAANMGKWGETSGIMKAAKEGLADLMKEWCEKIIELDENYKDGGGYRMLGIVHFKTPSIPFILSWPENDESLKNLKKALTYNKKDFLANTYYAQALEEDGQKTLAIALLEAVITWKPDPKQLLEDQKEIITAKELLEDYK